MSIGNDNSRSRLDAGAARPRAAAVATAAARPATHPRPHPLRSASASAAPKPRRRRKRRILLILLIMAAAAIATGWWHVHSRRATAEAAPATATVERRDFASSVLATGAVKPQVGAEVRVGARLSGKVATLRANIGDRVSKGEVIAELEKEDLEAIVAQREAERQLAAAKLAALERLWPKEIERARLELARWQATDRLYQQEISREEQLIQANASSQQAFEQAQERLAVARVQLASAETAFELAAARYEEEQRQAAAELSRTEAALDNARVQLSYATITAPIDGVIASVSTQEGETVAAGFNAPTFVTIIDLDRLQVDAYVDEVDIGKVRPGQQAVFTVDTFPGREFAGTVEAIYPKAVIQDNVVNYDVVIEILDRHEGALRPEMTASVTVLLEARTGVLAIPAKAVKRHRGKNVVYVSQQGRPEAREVQLGWKDGPWIEVLAGLEEDQTIFLEPPAAAEPQT